MHLFGIYSYPDRRRYNLPDNIFTLCMSLQDELSYDNYTFAAEQIILYLMKTHPELNITRIK